MTRDKAQPMFRFDLKARVFVLNTLLLLLATLVFAYVHNKKQEESFVRNMETMVHFTVKTIEPLMQSLLQSGNRHLLEGLARRITSPDIPGNFIVSVSIKDSRHQELVFSSQQGNDGPSSDARELSRVFTHVLRSESDGEIIAIMRFICSVEGLADVRSGVLTTSLISFLILLIPAYFLAFVLANFIRKPIGYLLEASRKISEGETSAHIDESTEDEIGVLIKAFNRMTETITLHLEELRKKNQYLDKRLFELSTLHHAGRAINSVLNLDQLYECIVDTAISMLGGVKRCSLLLVDTKTSEFLIKVAKGLDGGLLPKSRRVPLDSGVAGRVFASKESMVLNDLEDETDTNLLESAQVVRSSLVVPIKRNESVFAVISASNRISGEPFTQRDLSMLDSLSLQAGIAIKNAKLYQDLSRKILELNTLHEVGKSLSVVLDVEKLLEMILDLTGRVLGGVKKSSLILFDEETGELNVKIFKGLQQEQNPRPTKIGEGIAGKVFEQGEPIMINNVHGPDTQPEGEPYRGENLAKSSLCVPLKAKEKTIGVLSVSDKLSGEAFEENDLHMLVTLASQIAITINNAQLYEDLEASYLSAVRALANSLDAKDAYTHGHSERVAQYSLEIGKKMRLDPDTLKTLHIGALLHDIGKIGISEAIINKGSRLTDEEYELIKTHPVRGASIIEPAKFLKSKVPLIKYHHERYDGAGYPEGLAGDNIPLMARIVCVADSYDAMTSKRAYRDPIPRESAVKELVKCSGTHFDSRIVATFIEILNDEAKVKEIEKLGTT